MAIVLIDGQEIEIGDDERLNGIEVARRAGVEVPHYCWHPGLSVVASCRMCLVEAGTRNTETGEISMIPKLLPACQTPAKDGSVFVTNSEKVAQARAMVEEDLLINHPIDCPICDKAGECSLQDYHFQHGQTERRADVRPFTSRRRSLGDSVTLFVDRCVMCTRCVRFSREVSGESQLMVVNRGAHEEIDVFPGFPLDSKMAGNVVDLCPVGALGDKDFLYSQRVWFMKSHDSVCAGCSTGCSIQVDENQQQVYRLRPRENPQVNGWWMCDEGRYGYHHIHSDKRNTEPRSRVDGEMEVVDSSELPSLLDRKLKSAGSLALVLSPHLTVEEAFLLGTYVRSVDEKAAIALGPVPQVGEDETFHNGFTIHAEKCPNRRGVEKIVAHFMDAVVTLEDLIPRIESGEFNGVWVTGGYLSDGFDQESADRFADLRLLVVQDMFDSPLWQQADVQIPGAGFAEREGSYVNFADHLQSFAWAIRPPAGVTPEGRLAWQLLGRPGMFNARAALSDIAAEIAYFSAAGEEVPTTGMDLKLNVLTATTSTTIT